MSKYVILKNDEYYTDWIDSEELAKAEIEEYVSLGDGEYDEYSIRKMTFQDMEEHYPGDYTYEEWVEENI